MILMPRSNYRQTMTARSSKIMLLMQQTKFRMLCDCVTLLPGNFSWSIHWIFLFLLNLYKLCTSTAWTVNTRGRGQWQYVVHVTMSLEKIKISLQKMGGGKHSMVECFLVHKHKKWHICVTFSKTCENITVVYIKYAFLQVITQTYDLDPSTVRLGQPITQIQFKNSLCYYIPKLNM